MGLSVQGLQLSTEHFRGRRWTNTHCIHIFFLFSTISCLCNFTIVCLLWLGNSSKHGDITYTKKFLSLSQNAFEYISIQATAFLLAVRHACGIYGNSAHRDELTPYDPGTPLFQSPSFPQPPHLSCSTLPFATLPIFLPTFPLHPPYPPLPPSHPESLPCFQLQFWAQWSCSGWQFGQ